MKSSAAKPSPTWGETLHHDDGGQQHRQEDHFQVADINKPLFSISRVADLGFDCMLGKHGGMLVDTVTLMSKLL